MVKITAFVLLSCLLPTILCWSFIGYLGENCPNARQKMIEDPENRWMIPKCNEDGSYQHLQCFEGDDPDACMCVDRDGSAITLSGYGLNLTTCVCLVAGFKLFIKNHNAEMPKCANGGYFAPLQCSKSTNKCWCVDKYGNVLVPPSTEVRSCDIPLNP
ncbi:u36-Nephitoxin-Nsp1a_1 [Caerostris darwini]|uniref:U36-Nephitoxin-Nsp1a_1 n=1 Tax=Caerostris darwini TaxID=1538125 RepID=A0AAV4URF5_9ARAC|nr:u36-Nephitoxin-Nsp1a_1 [Caerostris darwini]